jgi:hypothetical protein
MVNATLKGRNSAGPRHTRLAGRTLEGVRQDARLMRPADARKLGETLAARGEVAYCVLPPEGSPRRSGGCDRRAAAREPMRLRSAKLVDAAFRFVSECRICDRSSSGLRIALARNVRLPRRFAVHIDESGEIRRAKVVWRRGLVVGIRLYEHASEIRPCDRFALRERYYGILD